MKKWKIAGISFDHMHMGDLLREAGSHPRAEIAGIADDNPENAESLALVRETLGIPQDRVFRDFGACLEKTNPDLVILCAATALHADFVERIAPCGAAILVEKPFAADLAAADRMIKAAEAAGVLLAVNWPLAWYPVHLTSKRLIDSGLIGTLCEVHYYDGNRGPTHHLMDKIAVSEDEALAKTKSSWWYRKDSGGGSLLDYLGYGTTLGTWFHGGRIPEEVTAAAWSRSGIEVDEHSIVAAKYRHGLSKYETRWGTFTDPWVHQPQPQTGFILVGTEGTIASYDYAGTVRVQTREKPEGYEIAVDQPPAAMAGPVAHLIGILENGGPLHGPLSLPIARSGQRIVDAARLSVEQRRTVRLEELP